MKYQLKATLTALFFLLPFLPSEQSLMGAVQYKSTTSAQVLRKADWFHLVSHPVLSSDFLAHQAHTTPRPASRSSRHYVPATSLCHFDVNFILQRGWVGCGKWVQGARLNELPKVHTGYFFSFFSSLNELQRADSRNGNELSVRRWRVELVDLVGARREEGREAEPLSHRSTCAGDRQRRTETFVQHAPTPAPAHTPGRGLKWQSTQWHSELFLFIHISSPLKGHRDAPVILFSPLIHLSATRPRPALPWKSSPATPSVFVVRRVTLPCNFVCVTAWFAAG